MAKKWCELLRISIFLCTFAANFGKTDKIYEKYIGKTDKVSIITIA
jgi:hypothetical protein